MNCNVPLDRPRVMRKDAQKTRLFSGVDIFDDILIAYDSELELMMLNSPRPCASRSPKKRPLSASLASAPSPLNGAW